MKCAPLYYWKVSTWIYYIKIPTQKQVSNDHFPLFWLLAKTNIMKQKWPNSLCKNIMFLNTIFKNTANQKRDFLLEKICCMKNPPFQMFHAIKINPGSLHSLIESKTSFFSSEQLFLSYKSKYEDMKIRCV